MTKKKSFFSDLSDSTVVSRITNEQQRKLNDIPPEADKKPSRKGRKAAKSGDPVIDKYINFNGENLVAQISPELKRELELIKIQRGDTSIKQLVAEAVVKHFGLK